MKGNTRPPSPLANNARCALPLPVPRLLGDSHSVPGRVIDIGFGQRDHGSGSCLWILNQWEATSVFCGRGRQLNARRPGFF